MRITLKTVNGDTFRWMVPAADAEQVAAQLELENWARIPDGVRVRMAHVVSIQIGSQ